MTAVKTGHQCSFPIQPPHGSFLDPGPCQECGKAFARSRAEGKLRDALAAMDATEPGDRLGYEYETVSDFRRGLAGSAVTWQEIADRHYEGRKGSQAAGDAYAGNLMAAGYSYALAAVLGVAAREYGEAVAKRLAWIAASLVTDGDSDELNADVMPVAEPTETRE